MLLRVLPAVLTPTYDPPVPRAGLLHAVARQSSVASVRPPLATLRNAGRRRRLDLRPRSPFCSCTADRAAAPRANGASRRRFEMRSTAPSSEIDPLARILAV